MPQAIPSVLLRPAPVSEPPYDDAASARSSWHVHWLGEGEGSGHGVQGQLPLTFRLPSGLPATPEIPATAQQGDSPTGRANAGGTHTDAGDAAGRRDRPARAGTWELPPARPWACRFTQALVEVLSGTRPPAQLTRWTSDAVFQQIGRRVSCSRRSAVAPRLVVRSIRLSLPREDATEVTAVVRTGDRSRAIALRLEGYRGQWLCTELEIG